MSICFTIFHFHKVIRKAYNVYFYDLYVINFLYSFRHNSDKLKKIYFEIRSSLKFNKNIKAHFPIIENTANNFINYYSQIGKNINQFFSSDIRYHSVHPTVYLANVPCLLDTIPYFIGILNHRSHSW